MKNQSNNAQGQKLEAVGYFTKSEYIRHGVYKDPEGYTPNAWIGTNCPKDRFLPVKEVAGYIREYIKKDPALRACKWSITTKNTAGCQSLTVALMAGPFDVFSEEWKEKHPFDVEHGHTQHGDFEKAVTPEAFRVISKVKAFAMSYNHDDSNGMMDYYDRGFYDHYHVGQWGKPYTRIETTEPAAAKKIKAHTELASLAFGSFQIVDYSENAIAVFGDTKPIKNVLRELGGRFNARLSCGAGWVFSKSKADEVREALAIK